MSISENLKNERRKRVVSILSDGLSRMLETHDKSSNMSKLEENEDSENVDYLLDNVRDKSVHNDHEHRKTQ